MARTDHRAIERSRDAGRWFVLACFLSFFPACAMGPQPIPTPEVRLEQLDIALYGDGQHIQVSGRAGAVQPPHAVVEILNLTNLDRAETRADAEGGFGPVTMRGQMGDVLRVTAISTHAETAGQTAHIDVVISAAQAAPDLDAPRPVVPDAWSGADAGGTGRRGDVAGVDDSRVLVDAVELVPSYTCLVVRPMRLNWEDSADAAAVDTASGNAASLSDMAETGAGSSDDGTLRSADGEPLVLELYNDCGFRIAIVASRIRPAGTFALQGDTDSAIGAGGRRKLTVVRRFATATAALETADPALGTLDSALADADADGDADGASADTVADATVHVVELHLSALRDERLADELDIRRIPIFRASDDPVVTASAPPPPDEVPTTGTRDVVGARDLRTPAPDVLSPTDRADVPVPRDVRVVSDLAIIAPNRDAVSTSLTGDTRTRDTSTSLTTTDEDARTGPPVTDREDASSASETSTVITPFPVDTLQPGRPAACVNENDLAILERVGREARELAWQCVQARCPDDTRDCFVGCIIESFSATDAIARTGELDARLLGRECAACFADEALCIGTRCANACRASLLATDTAATPGLPAPTETDAAAATELTNADAACADCMAEICSPLFERCAF